MATSTFSIFLNIFVKCKQELLLVDARSNCYDGNKTVAWIQSKQIFYSTRMKNNIFFSKLLDSIRWWWEKYTVSFCERFFLLNFILFCFIYMISCGLNHIQTDRITKASFKWMGWDEKKRTKKRFGNWIFLVENNKINYIEWRDHGRNERKRMIKRIESLGLTTNFEFDVMWPLPLFRELLWYFNGTKDTFNHLASHCLSFSFSQSSTIELGMTSSALTQNQNRKQERQTQTQTQAM